MGNTDSTFSEKQNAQETAIMKDQEEQVRRRRRRETAEILTRQNDHAVSVIAQLIYPGTVSRRRCLECARGHQKPRTGPCPDSKENDPFLPK